ncbi:MAG: LuxR C-terminal-related transcriptional regulator [Chloroflexota bacterium]
MSAPELLKVKLLIPPARRDLVERPKLFELLDQSLSGRLALVSAPAGYGKTTLLSGWARQLNIPVAWFSLDEGDNDPTRFIRHLCASLEVINPSIAGDLLDMIHMDRSGGQGSTASIEAFQAALLNRLQSIEHPFVVVLDDFHLISTRQIHLLVTFLLDHIPPQMHLVIASRADPALPLARLRAHGHLVEIRQSELRFTPDEAIALLNRVMGLNLDTSDVAALSSRTEGWIAGLRLAAASMQARTDVHRFIQEFKGSNRYILDYLVEEVLQRQPQEVQEFLLQTSILDRLTGPLCDAVVGCRRAEGNEGGERGLTQDAELRTQDQKSSTQHPASTSGSRSQAMLEMLERANLFIVPLDDERKWYRYHRLFADLLRKQLAVIHPELAPDLHRRASTWYEQHGFAAEAIEHALTAKDFERAAQLIERIAETTLMRSETATLAKWLDALPETQVRARPSLSLYYAWVMLFGGSPLESIEARFAHVNGYPALLALPLQAWAASYRGNIAAAIELSKSALEQLPEHEVLLRGLAALNLAGAYHANGDAAASERVLQEAALDSRQTGNVMVAVSAVYYQAERCRREGDLRKARSLFQRALDLATEGNGDRLPIASQALVGLGEIAREWNELDIARQLALEAIALAERWAPVAVVEAHLTLARIGQAKGDWEGVREALQTMRQTVSGFKATDIGDRLVDLAEAWMQVAQYDPSLSPEQALDGPRRWADRCGLGGDVDPQALEKEGDINLRRMRKYQYPVVARLRIAEGRPGEALELLESALPIVEKLNRIGMIIEYQILIALAARALGQHAKAIQSLERALALAEPAGFVRIFVDEGKPMARLLYEAASQHIYPEYVGRLLAAFPAGRQQSAFSNQLSAITRKISEPRTQNPELSTQNSLVEPLSERELEVLRLIAEGLSNEEIAQRLVVSLPTIKFHTSNIYGKLSVRNRTEAVAKARGRDILPLA